MKDVNIATLQVRKGSRNPKDVNRPSLKPLYGPRISLDVVEALGP